MAPISAQLGLLTLVSAALAQPYHGHGGLRHGRYHHRDVSSAAPYGFGNGTEAGPTAGSGTAPGTAYSTTTCTNYVTVQPVASTSAASVNTEYAAASSYPAGSSSSSCGGTVYETYTNTVTVTAGASSSVASAGTAFYPGTTSSAAASVASYSAPASPFSSYSAPAYSAPAPSSSAAASSSAPASSSAAPASSSYSAPAYSAPAPSSSSAAPYSAPAYSSTSSSSSSSSSSSAPAYTPTPYSSSTSTPSSSFTSSSATPSSTSAGTGKRGCIYASDPTHCDAILSDQVSWANNWVSTPGTGLSSSLTFVPQFHSMDQIWVDSWEAAATSGASVLAAWNEPDTSASEGGSGLTPAVAYSNWDLMTKYQSGSVRITSPAISSHVAPNQGLDWLQQFSKLGATWDITNIHFYGDCTNSANGQAFNDWVSSVRSAFPDQPMYVSEYGCYPGASDAQMSDFITSSAQFLDSQDYVERYAFFRADPGYLLSADGQVSSAGTTYATCT